MSITTIEYMIFLSSSFKTNLINISPLVPIQVQAEQALVRRGLVFLSMEGASEVQQVPTSFVSILPHY